jgi:hypothetical protein
MRRFWLLGIAVVAAGCGSHHARKVVTAKPAVTLPAAQVAAIERRRRRELIAAHVLRDRSLDENRVTLDALPVFPGAVVAQEIANAEFADEPSRRFALARQRGIVFEDDLLLAASGWGTFRIYRLPIATPTRDVVRFYVARLRPRWKLLRRDGDRFHLRRADRCLWFRVPRGSARLELGTDRAAPPIGC